MTQHPKKSPTGKPEDPGIETSAGFADEMLLPISALQHLLFCPRQCALIHIEQVWSENRLTVEGKNQHERVDEAGTELRDGVRTAFGVMLKCRRLGLTGKADTVEFHRLPDQPLRGPKCRRLRRRPDDSGGVILPGVQGRWRAYPVEHKHGRPKINRCDEAQLCAQALCLEEMLGTRIDEGALFYGRPRRRTVVGFDSELRGLTEDAARGRGLKHIAHGELAGCDGLAAFDAVSTVFFGFVEGLIRGVKDVFGGRVFFP